LPFCHLVLTASKLQSSDYPSQLNTLGDHIRKRRLDLGLYQKDVAKRLGVDENTIWRWERNESNPMVHHIPAIIRFLGYSPLPEPESLRDKLILRRKLLGVSQEAMAKQLGVNETTLRYIERGTRRASGRVRHAIRAFLAADQTFDSLWPDRGA
jgi:transcriptional regulator with XRE-family HTH domain